MRAIFQMIYSPRVPVVDVDIVAFLYILSALLANIASFE